MTISRVTSQDAHGEANNTLTVNWPATPASGDLLIAYAVYQTTTGITAPSGYTLLTSGNFNSGLDSSALYYKLATGSEVSVTAASNSGITGLTICEYTGNANPILTDGTAGNQNSGSSGVTTLATPSITTTNANDLIIVAFTGTGAATSLTWATSSVFGSQLSGFHQFLGQNIVSSTQTGFSDTATWTGSSTCMTLIGAFKAIPIITSEFLPYSRVGM